MSDSAKIRFNPARLMQLIKRLIVYCITVGLLIAMLAPFVWMLSTAIKPNQEIFRQPPGADPGDPFLIGLQKTLPPLIPDEPTADHFRRGWFEFPFPRYLCNTLVVVFFSCLGLTFSSALVAFSLAHLRWPDRNVLFVILLATMMIPGQLALIPHFLIFRQLGWIDTFLPLIVPAFLGSPFYIFLLRQFFLSLPRELIESARVDGAGNFRIFWQIVLPLSRPALVTVMILSLVFTWNDFMGPLIYLSSESTKTLAIGLAELRGQYETDWGLMMAVAGMMSLPIMVLFFVFQRAFVEGISLSGIKG